MSVIILTKPDKHDFETTKLVEEFESRQIQVRVCQFKHFDVIINKGIFYKGKGIVLPSIVLVRLGAGITRKELAVIRYFELAGIKCVNTRHSVNLVQDKLHTSEILSDAGIAVPTTMVVKFPVKHDLVQTHIGFPCIVKVVVGSFGEGVYLCQSEQEYHRVIEFVDALSTDKTLIVQEYLGDNPGTDLRVFVVGGKVIGAMKRTAPIGDFRANITIGGSGEAFQVTKEIEDIALRTASILGLDIAGIDLLFDNRGFRVCEANSNPGFSGFNKYCNVSIQTNIVDFIQGHLT